MSDHDIAHVAAGPGNCAAAAIAAMTGRSLEEVTAQLQAAHPEHVDDDGSSSLLVADFAPTVGLAPAEPVDTPAEWAALTAHGPATVTVGSFSFLVAGVQVSDDETVAESRVKVADPWRGVEWLPFGRFVAEYGVTPGAFVIHVAR